MTTHFNTTVPCNNWTPYTIGTYLPTWYYLMLTIMDKSGLIEFEIINWYIIHSIRDRFHRAIRLYILYLSYINNFSNVPIVVGLSTNRKKKKKGFSNEVVCQYCVIRLNEIRLSSRMFKKKKTRNAHTNTDTLVLRNVVKIKYFIFLYIVKNEKKN